MTQCTVLLAMPGGLDSILLSEAARQRLATAVGPVSGPTVDLQAVDDDVLASIDILLGGWGCPRLDAALLARMPRLRMVAHAGGTVRGIVTDALWQRGILVTSAAAANAVPVAEFAFAAIVFMGKDVFRVRDGHRTARGGVGKQALTGDLLRGNRGRRIGVVGASHTGRLLIERLRTFDCTIGVTDPYLSADEAVALGAIPFELDDLCTWCDVLSLHAPARAWTRNMIGANQLAAMRDGAWLLNTARGELVDTDALTAECVSGRLNAFIDTVEPSPLPADSPLYDLPNVVLTPHIAGSLGNEISRMGDLAVTEVIRWVHGEPPLYSVGKSDLSRIA